VLKVRLNFIFFLAVLVFGIGLTMFLMLYVRGADLLPKDFVFVPKDGMKIEQFTEITPNNFKKLFDAKEILKVAITPDMVTLDQMKEVINKTVVRSLYPGEYLSVHDVEDSVLVPHEGETGYPIPTSWFEVLDWTGRIGDIGDIWLSPSEELKTWYEQEKSNELKGEAAVSDNSKRLSATNQVGNVQFKAEATGNSANLDPRRRVIIPDLPDRPLSTPIYKDVRLRYIFDGSNKAIRTTEGVNDRSEGTGKPANAKLYLTEEQFALLKQAITEGYKLIFVVKAG